MAAYCRTPAPRFNCQVSLTLEHQPYIELLPFISIQFNSIQYFIVIVISVINSNEVLFDSALNITPNHNHDK